MLGIVVLGVYDGDCLLGLEANEPELADDTAYVALGVCGCNIRALWFLMLGVCGCSVRGLWF